MITLWSGGRQSIGLSVGTFINLLKRFLLHRRAKCLAKSTTVYVRLCVCVGGGGVGVFLISNFESDDPFL